MPGTVRRSTSSGDRRNTGLSWLLASSVTETVMLEASCSVRKVAAPSRRPEVGDRIRAAAARQVLERLIPLQRPAVAGEVIIDRSRVPSDR